MLIMVFKSASLGTWITFAIKCGQQWDFGAESPKKKKRSSIKQGMPIIPKCHMWHGFIYVIF